MPDRVFLDSNVILYAHSVTEPGKRKIAQALPEQYDAVISTQVLSEVGSVFTRKLRLPPAEAKRRVVALADGCDLFTVTEAIILDAFRIVEKYRYGFYDSQIIAAALASGVETLLSEDMQHGQVIDGVLTIQSPFIPAVRQPRREYGVKARRAVTQRAPKRTKR